MDHGRASSDNVTGHEIIFHEKESLKLLLTVKESGNT